MGGQSLESNRNESPPGLHNLLYTYYYYILIITHIMEMRFHMCWGKEEAWMVKEDAQPSFCIPGPSHSCDAGRGSALHGNRQEKQV